MVSLVSVVLFVLSLAPAPVLAQAAPEALAARLVEAREAQTAGRTGDVLRLTDDIVRLAPANRDAAALRIDALVANREIRRAAAEYDRYRVAAGAHDAQLLATVARAELWVLSGTGAGLQLRSLALERLARGGDAAALQALRASAKDSRATAAERLTADLSLARLGERDAVDRLVTIGESPDIPDRTPVVEALEAAGARSAQAWILQRLRETNPLTRAAAARALGTLKAFESIARLREMLSDSVFLVRFSAAISLKRLGDSSADPLLADWLQSDLPDVRLMAAEAYTESMTREWVTALKPVLQTPNELQRVKAAALLRRQDERASRSIVFDAVRSPNPAVRNEASRYLEALTPYDLGLLRSLLDDDSEWVRLHAAGALIKN